MDAEAVAPAYRDALALAETPRMRPAAAQCRLGLGALHRRTGERDEAREELAAAAEMFRAMVMTHWLARADISA